MFNVIFSLLFLLNVNVIDNSQFDGGFQSYNQGDIVYCYNVDNNYFNCYDAFVGLYTFNKHDAIDLSGEGYCDYFVGRNDTLNKYIIFNCETLNNDNIQGWVVLTKRDITP